MRKILASIFILILLAPALVWLTGLEFDIHVERLGLKPPRLDRQALLDNAYYLAFDQYFNDSFSLRSPLIFGKKWLDYHVFHMTDSDDIHVGSDGWLYSRQSIDSLRKVACKEMADIEKLVLQLHAIEKLIEATGRRFFFIVVPNKSTIYPEFVGSLPQGQSCNHNTYDLLLEAIESHPLKNFVRLDQLLRDSKSDALLYDPTSRFWNAQGAMLAAHAIHRQIAGDQVNKQVLDFKPGDAFSSDDLKNQLFGLAKMPENASAKHFRDSSQPDLPRAIVYGNDFTKKQLPYLQQMFSRFDLIQADSFPSRQHEEDLSDYAIILLESSESELGRMQIEIDRIFSVFKDEALRLTRHPMDLQTAVPVSNISLKPQKRGLQIKSVGHQSSFKLISIPGSDAHIFRVLNITMTSFQADNMTIKFMRRLPYTSRKSLKPGLSELYLPLPFQKSISLTLHPGDKAGVFALNSAEIIEFPDRVAVPQPTPQKITIAKAHPKQKAPNPQMQSAAGSTQSPPETRISVPDSKNRDTDPKSKMASSPDSELAKLKRVLVESTGSADTDPPLPEKMKASDSVSRTETDASKAASKRTKQRGKTAKLTPTPAEVASSGVPAINLSDFANGRIFQRKNRGTHIVVSGTYTLQVEAIEARVIKDGTLEEIVPWTVIDTSPRNGIFVGTLMNVPQGGWYNLQVRSTNRPEISIHGSHKWGVGMLVACLGQSNMKEWFYTGTELKAHPLLRIYTDNGWSAPGKQGNAAIAFGNRIIDRLGIPVGLLDYSKNGSGLRKEADWGTGYWENTAPGSIYNRFISGVSETGGAVEFVVWIQGEADAARGTVTEEEYAASLERFITNQVRMDIVNGSDFENLPFLIVMMIKRPGGKDKPHQAIRNAQKYVAETVANTYLAATTLDLKNHGRQHLTPKAYITLGRRVSQSILHLLDEETYHRGPKVSHVIRIDSQTIEIRIQHTAGSDFTPDSGITGWEVITNGVSVPIGNVYRHDPQTIRIDLERPLNEKAQIRYLFGAMPDVKRPVLDNSPLSLPLEEFQADIN